MLYKKSNNISIKIASPVLELPFKAHNSEFVGEDEEQRERKWSVNLGNFHFQNFGEEHKQKKEMIDEYERFNIKIDQMGL